MQALGQFFARWVRYLLPDPFVLACLLTAVVIGVAVVAPQESALADQSVGSRIITVASLWLEKVWSAGFLRFALQMCVVLLTGFGLARSPIILRALRGLAGRARSDRGGIVLIGLISCVGCWINWGFGVVLAGIMAAELQSSFQRRRIRCNYPLIVAAAYAGMMIWHGGLSGSAPLKVASDGVELHASATAGVAARSSSGGPGASDRTENTNQPPAGVDDATSDSNPGNRIAPIPITRTIGAPVNLVLTLVLVIGIPFVLRAMSSRPAPALNSTGEESTTIDALQSTDNAIAAARDNQTGTIGRADEPFSNDRADGGAVGGRSLADRLNHSRLIPMMIGLLIFTALWRQVASTGSAAIGLDFVNSVFLGAGLLLHRNLASYCAAVTTGGQAIVGIVLQFPLYAGIQGVMVGAGLAAAISHGFVNGAITLADTVGLPVGATFPVATFFSAGLVNFFVPSGGGQWIVQGPIMCAAAKSLSLPYEQTIMAIAYGDQWTNMIQPFWAIPLMGLTRAQPRAFMGYCALLMLIAAPVFLIALLCW